MDVPTWVWWTTIAVTVSVLLFDVIIIGRRPHEPSTKEVSISLSVYVGLAIVFGIGVWVFAGHQFGTEFFAGWLTEYSLSVDNLFIFIIIMAKFGVPRQYQQEALMVGIVLALVMRAIFIAVGAAAINEFSWIFYIFGLFLVYTAVKLAKEGSGDDDDFEENRLIKWVETHLPATDQWHGVKLIAKENGKRLITPMFIVILALGTTDLLFALDSIPAIYGLTKEPYLVLTANIFALMGLRQLYFLIGGLLQRLVYLSYGLAVLLGFIGVKLVLHAMHENELPFINGGEHIEWAPEIPILVSLGAIVAILGITTVASLIASKRGVQNSSALAAALDPDADADGPMTTVPDLPRPTDGDVIDLILDDHRVFESLLRDLRDVTADREEVRRTLAALHVAHAEAEERHVYPALRRKDAIGDHEAEHGEEEHAEGHEAMLKVLAAPEVEGDDFDELVEELASTLNHHLTEEELTILNPAREDVSADVRRELGRAFAEERNRQLDSDCGRVENLRHLVQRAQREGLLSQE